MNGIADTGLSGCVRPKPRPHHDWAMRVAEQVTEPLLTCEAVLAETAFHLSNAGNGAGDDRRRVALRFSFDCNDHLPQLASP